MDRTTSVLVTGVGGRSVGHQILHALRLLGPKYRIVATDADPYSFGLYQTDCRYIVPRATAPDYCDAIARLVENEKIDVILPGTEAEVLVLAHNAERFRKLGCVLIASALPVIERCANKEVLYSWLAANGIGVPRSVRGNAWRKFVSDVGFPVVAKPSLASGGSRNVAILATPDEVDRYFVDTGQDPQTVVIQEYVGSTESEFTVGVMVSKTGGVIDSIIIHRKLVGLTQGITRMIDGKSFGLSTGYSQGYVVRDESLRNFCEDLALRIGARGPLNIQCRRHGDAIKVLEVHPRFSGTTSIRADVGFNEPDILIENFLFDRPFARLSYRDDVAVIRAFQTIVVPRTTLATVPRA